MYHRRTHSSALAHLISASCPNEPTAARQLVTVIPTIMENDKCFLIARLVKLPVTRICAERAAYFLCPAARSGTEVNIRALNDCKSAAQPAGFWNTQHTDHVEKTRLWRQLEALVFKFQYSGCFSWHSRTSLTPTFVAPPHWHVAPPFATHSKGSKPHNTSRSSRSHPRSTSRFAACVADQLQVFFNIICHSHAFLSADTRFTIWLL